jgi:hypothetical protein
MNVRQILSAAVPLLILSACAFTPRTAAVDNGVAPEPSSGSGTRHGTSRAGSGAGMEPGGYRGLNPDIYFGY